MDAFKKIAKIHLKKLNSELHISEEFIVSIHDERNSWSFISKLAQLIEGFFTQILVQRLDEKDAYETISNLPQATRLNLAYALKIITNEQRFLFLTIAEIRNDYIHNISNAEVDLCDYFQTLKSSRRTEIHKRFKPYILDENWHTSEGFFLNCTNSIFTACIFAIARIHGEMDVYSKNRKHAEFRAKQAEQLLPKIADDAIFMEDHVMVLDFIKDAKNILKRAGLLTLKFPSKTEELLDQSR